MRVSTKASRSRHERPVPVRTCVGCRRERPKREMVRVVRTPAGTVQVDATGKAAGRGAYICPQRSCWEQAIRRQRLATALHVAIEPGTQETLISQGRSYPAEGT